MGRPDPARNVLGGPGLAVGPLRVWDMLPDKPDTAPALLVVPSNKVRANKVDQGAYACDATG